MHVRVALFDVFDGRTRHYSSMTSFTTLSRYWLAISNPRCTSASGIVWVKIPSVENRPCSISETASGKSYNRQQLLRLVGLISLRAKSSAVVHAA
jgi:hypothetical protein